MWRLRPEGLGAESLRTQGLLCENAPPAWGVSAVAGVALRGGVEGDLAVGRPALCPEAGRWLGQTGAAGY